MALERKYAFITAHREQFCIAAMCRVRQVRSDSYYVTAKRLPGLHGNIELAQCEEIKHIYAAIVTRSVLSRTGTC